MCAFTNAIQDMVWLVGCYRDKKSRGMQLEFQEDEKPAELEDGQMCLADSTKCHKSCCYIGMKLYHAIFSVLLFRI